MRPLTKSRFKLALDCPTKLYYTGKSEYENTNDADSFMEALAEGGYQVGELAKQYYPGGYDITEKGYNTPLERTNQLLKQDSVVIFEAAILFENLFIRVDILEKIGNTINLIEVKAKSYNGGDEGTFLNKRGFVDSGWNSYLQDVAFQKYVAGNALPNMKINAFLMLADKSKKATVNGLNQKFQIVHSSDGRKSIDYIGDEKDSLGSPILTTVNVNNIADRIVNDTALQEKPVIPFREKIELWSDHYERDKKIISQVGLKCFGCEYQSTSPQLRNGFRECWSHFYSWSEEQYAKPKITELWNYRRKQSLFEEGLFFMDEIQKHHIGEIMPNGNGTLSSKERQWMQVEKLKKNDESFYLDKDGMKDLMDSFIYPLHFIDFETSMVAIPFYEGQGPYEQVAFQFSHHIMREDGSIEHVGEFIETEKGKFPNFDFVRALKKELELDEGTIFRYAAHENTVLNQICAQLLGSHDKDVPDKNELVEFIYSITNSKDAGRHGERDMVDMLEMVKKYYYDPSMKGSNSIKKVLPSALNNSQYIQEKYSKPIYGKNSEIRSLNFEDGWCWIQRNELGEVNSPYDLLPGIFEDLDKSLTENFITDEHLADGGSAMIAFAKMQFTEMSELERNNIISGLLKYCELDTLAMVMIFEFWKNEIEG
jgi:hypothetical protein